MVLKQKQRNVNTPWGRGSRGLVLGVGGYGAREEDNRCWSLVQRTTSRGQQLGWSNVRQMSTRGQWSAGVLSAWMSEHV